MSTVEAGNLFSVKGLVAVITGGGTGIGLMMAEALDANGAAAVYIVGRRKEPLEAAAKEAVNKSIIPLQGDVTSKDSLASLAEHVKNQRGYVNVLIANSGITGPKTLAKFPKDATLEDYQAALWNTPMEDFTQTFAVNTTAVLYTALAFLPLLAAGNVRGNVEQKSQVIATTAAGAFSRVSLASFAYSASKAATTHLMKCASTALSKFHVRFNTIAPGLYPSDMSAGLFEGRLDVEGSVPREQIPLTRAGTVEDMAGLVLFLCSRAGAYVDGGVLLSDGGRIGLFPSTY